MDTNHISQTAIRFNSFINSHNLTGLAELMTTDHTFIDSEGNQVVGKENSVKAWESFFRAFPDYVNYFDKVLPQENNVSIAGKSQCSDKRLCGPVLWKATIRDGNVARWHIFVDTPANRKDLGL